MKRSCKGTERDSGRVLGAEEGRNDVGDNGDGETGKGKGRIVEVQ